MTENKRAGCQVFDAAHLNPIGLVLRTTRLVVVTLRVGASAVASAQ